MQRVTISMDETLAAAFDELIADQSYQSRSEALRDLVRQAIEERRLAEQDSRHCVASLSYVYDHHTRALAQRLVELQHEHHDIVVATMHVHLDHESCLETAILRGPIAEVRALADGVKAERGVRFAEINLVSVRPNDHHHPDTQTDHVHDSRGHLSPHRG